MTPDLEYLDLEDRQVLLKNIEGLQQRLSLVAHTLISQPQNPLPNSVWDSLDMALSPLRQRQATGSTRIADATDG